MTISTKKPICTKQDFKAFGIETQTIGGFPMEIKTKI